MLASDKREVASKLQQECLQLSDQRILELGLRVLVLEPKELENIP